MKVTKWIELGGKEIDVHIDVDDIERALCDDDDSERASMQLINKAAAVLKGIPQQVIQGMKPKTKVIIHDFISGQAMRFYPTGPGRCSPQCPGWFIANDTEIQRCDECKRFQTDHDALNHVAMLAWQGEKNDRADSRGEAGVSHQVEEAGEEGLREEQRQGAAGEGEVGAAHSEAAS